MAIKKKYRIETGTSTYAYVFSLDIKKTKKGCINND